MTPRTVNLTALLRGYRAACYANNINPATGNPARCDNPHWWRDVSLAAAIPQPTGLISFEQYLADKQERRTA